MWRVSRISSYIVGELKKRTRKLILPSIFHDNSYFFPNISRNSEIHSFASHKLLLSLRNDKAKMINKQVTLLITYRQKVKQWKETFYTTISNDALNGLEEYGTWRMYDVMLSWLIIIKYLFSSSMILQLTLQCILIKLWRQTQFSPTHRQAYSFFFCI